MEILNQSLDLRDYKPPVAMEVFVRGAEGLFVPGSLDKSRPTQLAMTEEHSRTTIETIHQDAKVLMLPATAQAQMDKAYRKISKGEPLFKNIDGRALDDTSAVSAAMVSRSRLDDQHGVNGWNADDGVPFIGAVSAVEFLQK